MLFNIALYLAIGLLIVTLIIHKLRTVFSPNYYVKNRRRQQTRTRRWELCKLDHDLDRASGKVSAQ